jgi:hypothetical protein
VIAERRLEGDGFRSVFPTGRSRRGVVGPAKWYVRYDGVSAGARIGGRRRLAPIEAMTKRNLLSSLLFRSGAALVASPMPKRYGWAGR